MVARGDLGVEVGYAKLTGLQKRILHTARIFDRVTITATQMMESMIHSPVPTRAEVSDVANAVLDGTDAVMLSAETAAGKYPVEVVENMRSSASGAPPERLPWPVASEYQVAGDKVAFLQPNLAGLTLCDLGSLRCEPLDAGVDESNRFDWFLTPDAVWYRTPTPEVVRYDLAKRAITWRHAYAPTAFGVSLAVSPDERSLLVAREAPPLIDLMYAPRVAHK